jgi:hypothetical protein
VTKAVAFGDFLSGPARVQAAEKAAEREFMRRLKARSPALDIRSYEDWMGSRSHRKLL